MRLKTMLFWGFLLSCLAAMPAQAAFDEVITVEEIVASNQSPDAVEAFALQKAKRLAIEKAGTFISSTTVVEQGRLTKDQITTLASGILNSDIVGIPERGAKNNQIFVRVKVRVKVDTTILEQQIQAMLQDKELLNKLESERQQRLKLEQQLQAITKADTQRLEQLNTQAQQLEIERQRRIAQRQQDMLKAQKELTEAQRQRLERERELQQRNLKKLEELEAQRQAEAQAIAQEQDRVKKAQLENEARLKEIQRQAQEAALNWVSVDQSLSLEQAMGEVRQLKQDVFSLNQNLDEQHQASQKNLTAAFDKQISLTNPKLPNDLKEKDPFETNEEFAKRKQVYEGKVAQAHKANEKAIRKLEAEKELRLAELKLSYLQRKSEVLQPFVARLSELQQTQFLLPEEKITAEIQPPEADKFRFPVKISYQGKSWTQYWIYDSNNRNLARDIYTTRGNLKVEGLFQITDGATSCHQVLFANLKATIKIARLLTAAKLTHLGTGKEVSLSLESVPNLLEICALEHLRSHQLPETQQILKVTTWKFENGIGKDMFTGMEFVEVQAGCYQMGCGSWTNSCESDEKPVHEVCLNSFFLAKTEVTQGQWQKVMGNNPSSFKRGSNYPVERVSWSDAQAFIEKLNQKSGLACGGSFPYQTGCFRLPTEAEWEYACRSGGQMVAYGSAGGSLSHDLINYRGTGGRDGFSNTSPMEHFPPNKLGLYDMSGNVWEWVQDVYSSNAYRNHAAKDPIYTGSGDSRVVRGGSWDDDPEYVRCANRYYSSPTYRDYDLGFRLARTD